jgi:hypothetical protein
MSDPQKSEQALNLFVTEETTVHTSTCHCIRFFTQFTECSGRDCK